MAKIKVHFIVEYFILVLFHYKGLLAFYWYWENFIHGIKPYEKDFALTCDKVSVY